ncbi:MAG: PilW family protein [Opitutaceae bacterium]
MKPNASVSRSKGFSVVELIVAMTISAFVMTSMVATFIVFAAGSESVAGYTEMSQQSRKALELFARDMRAAADVTTATESDLVVVYPQTSYYDAITVQYTFDKTVGIFSRIERALDGTLTSNDTVLDGVEQFTFDYYDPLGGALEYSQASLLLSIKSVRIDAEMLRNVSDNDATDYIISARFMMRNRPVTE